jgi:basic membrane protein A
VAYQGLLAAKAELGVDIAYSEALQPPEYLTSFGRFAIQGYDLVIGHGSEFSWAALEAAKEFPQTYFAVTNSNVHAPNLAGLDTKNEEMGYIGGYIAGLISQSGVVAFIGATQIVAMVRAEQGFHLGVQAACPGCKTLVEYIGSFDNQERGRDIARALIEQGVDVLFNNDDEAGIGSLQLAEEKGVLSIGSDYDQKPVAPKSVVTSILAKVSPMIISIIREIKEGAFLPDQARIYGFDTGTYDLTPLDMQLITAEQAEKINQVRNQLQTRQVLLPHLDALTS